MVRSRLQTAGRNVENHKAFSDSLPDLTVAMLLPCSYCMYGCMYVQYIHTSCHPLSLPSAVTRESRHWHFDHAANAGYAGSLCAAVKAYGTVSQMASRNRIPGSSILRGHESETTRAIQRAQENQTWLQVASRFREKSGVNAWQYLAKQNEASQKVRRHPCTWCMLSASGLHQRSRKIVGCSVS